MEPQEQSTGLTILQLALATPVMTGPGPIPIPGLTSQTQSTMEAALAPLMPTMGIGYLLALLTLVPTPMTMDPQPGPAMGTPLLQPSAEPLLLGTATSPWNPPFHWGSGQPTKWPSHLT